MVMSGVDIKRYTPDQFGRWSGKAALELSNLSRMPMALDPGIRIRSAGEFKG